MVYQYVEKKMKSVKLVAWKRNQRRKGYRSCSWQNLNGIFEKKSENEETTIMWKLLANVANEKAATSENNGG